MTAFVWIVGVITWLSAVVMWFVAFLLMRGAIEDRRAAAEVWQDAANERTLLEAERHLRDAGVS